MCKQPAPVTDVRIASCDIMKTEGDWWEGAPRSDRMDNPAEPQLEGWNLDRVLTQTGEQVRGKAEKSS